MDDILRKKNVKCTALENEDDVSELICDFIHFFFGGEDTTVFTKPTILKIYFDIQTSAGACWKENALQNVCALLEFQ